MPTIDINCDLGEAFGNFSMPNDKELMKYISSVNIACGFHAGDPGIMENTVHLAMENDLALGAHPGFPDLQGFGRREMKMSPKEIYQITLYQIGALSAIIKAAHGNLHHIKAHGALYNMAAKNKDLEKAFSQAIFDINPELLIYGLSGSEMIHEAKNLGLETVSEVFADRRYDNDGNLCSRDQEDSMITQPLDSLNQILHMIQNHTVLSKDGKEVPVVPETLCIHGDSKNAVPTAQLLFKSLVDMGIRVKAPGK